MSNEATKLVTGQEIEALVHHIKELAFYLIRVRAHQRILTRSVPSFTLAFKEGHPGSFVVDGVK